MGHWDRSRSDDGPPIDEPADYDQLQAKGIRCWLDVHDLVVGERILEGVNTAIRLFDRVVLCCSRASLTSSWVDDEIAMAFQKERQTGHDILVPLDLDGFLHNEWTSARAVRVRERLAADFINWRSSNSKFEKGLASVVRALSGASSRC